MRASVLRLLTDRNFCVDVRSRDPRIPRKLSLWLEGDRLRGDRWQDDVDGIPQLQGSVNADIGSHEALAEEMRWLDGPSGGEVQT